MEAVTHTKHCSRIFKNSVQISLFLYSHFGLGSHAARTQYLTHTTPTSSTFSLSLDIVPILHRSTTSPVACEHKNQSLLNTLITCYPSAVSPWHGSLAICIAVRMTPSLSAVGWLPRHPHTAFPWKDFIAIRCRTVTWLPCLPSAGRMLYRSTIARSPQGEPPRGEPHEETVSPSEANPQC
jgi:hypothetical protein